MKRAREASESQENQRHARQRLAHDRSATDIDDESTQMRSMSSQRKHSRAGEQKENSDEEDQEGEILDFTQSEYASQIDTMCRTTGDDTNSQKTPSMPSRIENMAPKTREELTALLVRYMLYKANLKLPIKFSDIAKDVFPKYKNISRYFFQKAKEHLENVFGYRVVPVDETSSREIYIVINSISSQEHLLQLNKNSKSATKGLLMMILGLLWCASNRKLSEADLWRQLSLIDNSIKMNKIHVQLGDVQALFKTFETQLYLQASFEVDDDLKKVKYYCYGARALSEVGNVQILNFVCKLITGRSPSDLQIDEVALEHEHS